MTHTILRLPTVKARTGLSRSTLYLKVSRGEFPTPIHLGPRAVGWLESDVVAWIAEQVERAHAAKSAT